MDEERSRDDDEVTLLEELLATTLAAAGRRSIDDRALDVVGVVVKVAVRASALLLRRAAVAAGGAAGDTLVDEQEEVATAGGLAIPTRGTASDIEWARLGLLVEEVERSPRRPGVGANDDDDALESVAAQKLEAPEGAETKACIGKVPEGALEGTAAR